MNKLNNKIQTFRSIKIAPKPLSQNLNKDIGEIILVEKSTLIERSESTITGMFNFLYKYKYYGRTTMEFLGPLLVGSLLVFTFQKLSKTKKKPWNLVSEFFARLSLIFGLAANYGYDLIRIIKMYMDLPRSILAEGKPPFLIINIH